MSRIDIQEVRAFQASLKRSNAAMRTSIQKMNVVAFQYAADTSISGQAIQTSKAYFQENYAAICASLIQILNTSEELLESYLNDFHAQVDSSPTARVDADVGS